MERYKINFTKTADRDIDKIYDYISIELENFLSAEKIIGNINKKCHSLAVFPKVSPVKIIVGGKRLRFAHCGNYTIVYSVYDKYKTINIEHIFYSHQNILDLFN